MTPGPSEWRRCADSVFAFPALDEIQIGEIGRGRKYVSAGETYSGAHFPQSPILPGVIIIGAAACIAHAMTGAPARPPRIRRIRRFRFASPVQPGDLLEFAVMRLGEAGRFRVEARVDDRVVAHGRLDMEC